MKLIRKYKPTPAGNRFHEIFVGRYRTDGSIELVLSDVVDIKQEINSHRAECDMSYILSLLNAGDTSVLNTAKPMYGDFTQFPTSYADILNLYNDCQSNFGKLSPDVRNAYGNDMYKFFCDIGSDNWCNLMHVTIKQPEKEPEKEPEKPIETKKEE